jgi:hypothetical protein
MGETILSNRAATPLQAGAVALEQPLAALESSLAALGEALQQRDAVAIEAEAAGLHATLAAAVDHFAQAARTGGVPPPLRTRLALAGGQVAAQREALARATAALDRAMDVLLPPAAGAAAALYGARGAMGGTERAAGGFIAA